MLLRSTIRNLMLVVGWIIISGGFTAAWPTETYRSAVSEEHANGIVAHIVQTVAERAGISVDMRLAPFARRLDWMETGEIDFMGGLLKRPRRESYIYYISTPYVKENRKMFFVRKGEEARITRYDDLYGLIIGTKIHSRYFSRFDQDQNLKKEPVSNVEQNFKKLLAGRIDAVIYGNRSGHSKLIQMGISDRVGVAHYTYTQENPVFIGISKRSPLMSRKSQLESTVRQMVESGEMASIIQKYYENLRLSVFDDE